MVFSGAEAVSGDKGHGGDVTGGDPMAIRSVTSTGVERDDTRVTRDDSEVVTGEEVEDVTSKRPDRVLIGCEDMALT